MAEEGKAWPLICGYGRVFGAYVIQSIDEGQTHATSEGIPTRIEFNLQLQRAQGDLDALGMLGSDAASLLGG